MSDGDRDDLIARLRRVPVSVIHDVMRGLGLDGFVLPPAIRPLAGGAPLAGPVFTFEGRESKGLSTDDSLLAWAKLLSAVPPEVIAICQPNTRDIALMGEISARALKVKGALGYVVDGACRDIALVEEAGFPVWSTHATPSDLAGRWCATALAEPITIGDVRIENGDWFTGDRDGAIILPRAQCEAIVSSAEDMMGTESAMRSEILSGTDPVEALRRHGKF